MSYVKQTFIDAAEGVEGTVLRAQHLNHIEDGIKENEKNIDSALQQISSLQSGAFSECLLTRYEPINKKVFEGKKLWVFGDSITAGVGTTSPDYFSEILKTNLGCASLKRLGNSGYAFSQGLPEDGYCILDKMETSLKDAPGNCDILIICFGVNDWTWGTKTPGDRAIGQLLDTTKYTICGAVNLFCQKLQTIFKDYPDVKIYFSTPTPTKNAPRSGGNPAGKSWDQTKKNINGNTLRDICNAIIQTVSLYGYQALDLNLYFDGDITDHAAMDAAFPDGLHPGPLGNQQMASTLEKLMCANPITSFTFNPLVTTLSPLAKNLIYKETKVQEAEAPNITVQPIGASYNINNAATALSITASVSDGGSLSYQWYKNNSVISGATSNTYTPSTAVAGTFTYYCAITNQLGTALKVTKSNVVTITVSGEISGPTDVVEELNLSELAVNHLKLSNATGSGENLLYMPSDHTLSVNDTGWYKSSYITTPLKVGTEIELTTYYSKNVTGNAILIYSQEDLNNPTQVEGSFWPASSIFGIYASGSDAQSEPLYQWDTSKAKIDPYAASAMNDGKTVILKLKADGVHLFIDGTEITLPHYNTLTSGNNYYLGLRSSCTTAGTLCAMINYIGPLR